MVVLNFILTPEAASKIHDLLVCLGKFSDTVAIEARREKVGRSSSCLYQVTHLIHFVSSPSPPSTLQNPPMPLQP